MVGYDADLDMVENAAVHGIARLVKNDFRDKERRSSKIDAKSILSLFDWSISDTKSVAVTASFEDIFDCYRMGGVTTCEPPDAPLDHRTSSRVADALIASGTARMLNSLPMAVLVVNSSGLLVYSNHEAQRILQERDGVALDGQGRLSFTDTSVNQVVTRLFAREHRCPTNANDGHLACAIRRRSGQQLVTDVSRIDPEGGATITLVDTARTNHDLASRLRQLYPLTNCEAEICALMAAGYGNAEIASIRSVSVETVKSQAASVMRKLDALNRVDVVRTVLFAALHDNVKTK